MEKGRRLLWNVDNPTWPQTCSCFHFPDGTNVLPDPRNRRSCPVHHAWETKLQWKAPALVLRTSLPTYISVCGIEAGSSLDQRCARLLHSRPVYASPVYRTKRIDSYNRYLYTLRLVFRSAKRKLSMRHSRETSQLPTRQQCWVNHATRRDAFDQMLCQNLIVFLVLLSPSHLTSARIWMSCLLPTGRVRP